MRLKKIFFLILLVVFPLKVYANSLDCPKVAFSSEEISCRLKIDNAVGIKAKYNLGSNFTYMDVVSNGNWKIYYKDKVGFVSGNIIDSKGIDFVIKLKVADNLEVNKEYSLKVTNIETTDMGGDLSSEDDISTSIKIVSNNSYLKTLSLSNMDFTEEFKKDKYVYYAETLEDSAVISAVAEDSSSVVSGDIGNQILNYGINLYVIKVTSAYGYIREYKVYITRNYDESAKDATLKSIKLSFGELEFKKDNFLYEVFVGNDVDTIDVEAVASNSKAIIDIVKPEKLEVGKNEIIITVTAVDGTQCKYVIVVNREKKILSDQDDLIDNKDDEHNDNVYSNKSLNSRSKIKIYVVTILLLVVLLVILVLAIKGMIKFIKRNYSE